MSDPCPDGRCLHDGTCSPADNSDGFVCDCTGTLYKGKTCDEGLVVVDPIGFIKLRVGKLITVRAKPDNAATYQIEGCFGVTFPIQGSYYLDTGCNLEFNQTVTSRNLTLTAYAVGPYSLKFVGVNTPPVPFVVTSDSSTSFVDEIRSSCCGNILPICPDLVQLKSSSCWDTMSKQHITRGIVFIEYDNMKVPLSLAGLQITTSGTITTTLPSRNSNAMCGSCGLTPLSTPLSDFKGNCYEHIPTPEDLSEFVKNQSLTVSFLSSIRTGLFPSWFSLNKAEDMDALNKLSNTDFLAKMVSSDELLKEDGCESLVIENSEGQFILLQHNGPLNLRLKTKMPSIHVLQSPLPSNYYCVAVHVCSGQSSPVYIGLPPSAQAGINRISFISNYIKRGWKFNFQSATLTKMPQNSVLRKKLWNGVAYSEHISRVRIQYDTLVNMKAEGQYSYGMANVKLKFNGSVQYNYVTEESSQVTIYIPIS